MLKIPIWGRNKMEIFISWSKDKSRLLAVETKKYTYGGNVYFIGFDNSEEYKEAFEAFYS